MTAPVPNTSAARGGCGCCTGLRRSPRPVSKFTNTFPFHPLWKEPGKDGGMGYRPANTTISPLSFSLMCPHRPRPPQLRGPELRGMASSWLGTLACLQSTCFPRRCTSNLQTRTSSGLPCPSVCPNSPLPNYFSKLSTRLSLPLLGELFAWNERQISRRSAFFPRPHLRNASFVNN